MSRWKLPENWQWAPGGAIAEIVGGGTPPTKDPENFSENGIPWLTPSDLSDYQGVYISRGRRDLSQKGYDSCGAQLMPRDSVLFTSRAPIGYCVIASNDICTNQGFKSFVLMGNIDPKFIRHYLLASKDYAESLGSGSTFTELSGARIAELEFPIPPLNEQKRIVARIEELQARSRRAREVLKALPDLLEQLRQSLLAAAFRGDLSKEWREKNPSVDPASELLKRIRAERRKKWEEAELEKLKAKGLIGEKVDEEFLKRRKQYKDPTPVDTTDLPQLPTTWCWVAAEELVPIDAPIIYGILQPGPDIPDGVPYVRPTEIEDDHILLDSLRKTSSTIASRYKRSQLKTNDILLSMVGTIGKVVIVPQAVEGGNITQSSVRIRPDSTCVSPDYLAWSLRSPFLREQYEKYRLGTAVPRLNVEDVRRLVLPVAPQREQTYVLNVINERLTYMLGVQRYVQNDLDLIKGLEESVMRKAFLGELVPQDPNDEPASVLLERIREEKARMAAKQQINLKQGGMKKMGCKRRLGGSPSAVHADRRRP
jgi:type I restriction enzyme S subunit